MNGRHQQQTKRRDTDVAPDPIDEPLTAGMLILRIAINRKLRDTALRERRFEDANYYSKCAQADELRARKLLEQKS